MFGSESGSRGPPPSPQGRVRAEALAHCVFHHDDCSAFDLFSMKYKQAFFPIRSLDDTYFALLMSRASLKMIRCRSAAGGAGPGARAAGRGRHVLFEICACKT
jgi:hypothetical protein